MIRALPSLALSLLVGCATVQPSRADVYTSEGSGGGVTLSGRLAAQAVLAQSEVAFGANTSLSQYTFTSTAPDNASGFVCAVEGCRFCMNPSCSMYWESNGGGSMTTGSAVTMGSNTLISGVLTTRYGTSNAFRVVSTLNSPVFTNVGNVGAGTDDLMTMDVPAITLGTSQIKGLRIIAWGTTANNANAKTVTLNWGSQVIMTQALTASIAGTWRIEAYVLHTGTNTQDVFAELLQLATLVQKQTLTAGTQTTTSTITIKCTAAATADNDIVQDGLIVEIM